jgi:hypothetical protein
VFECFSVKNRGERIQYWLDSMRAVERMLYDLLNRDVAG